MEADFGNESDDGVVGLVPYEIHSSSEDSFELPIRTKTRKRRVQAKNSTWFAEKNKSLRESGKQYFGKRIENDLCNYKVVKNSRLLKQRCDCLDKGSLYIMKCAQITESITKDLFKDFWQISWGEKKF